MDAAKIEAIEALMSDYIPLLSCRETPISVLDGNDVNLDVYENDRDIGVLSQGPEPLEYIKEEAAFIFGESPDDLFFRANFSTTVKIDCGEDKKSLLERLFNAHAATLFICTPHELKTEEGIPVFHDAGELQMFLSQDSDDDCEKEEDADEDDDGNSPPVGLVRRPYDDGIDAYVDAIIAARNGQLLARHGTNESATFKYDVAIIDKLCYVIVHNGEEGDWLADEETPHNDSPLWFSEYDHMPSPVYFADNCRNYLLGKINDLQVVTMVVNAEKCFIINEDEMLGIWEEKCNVKVVRTKSVEGSVLPTMDDCINSLPARPEANEDTRADAIRKADQDLISTL